MANKASKPQKSSKKPGKTRQPRQPRVVLKRISQRFARTLSEAYADQLGHYDEALGETLAETIARRVGDHFRKGRITNTYRAFASDWRDSTEGRPAQTLKIRDGSKEFHERSYGELKFHQQHERWPETPVEEAAAKFFEVQNRWPTAEEIGSFGPEVSQANGK